MVKGIFFDLYGTLFIYGDMQAELDEWLLAFHACLKRRGLSISEKSFTEYFHGQRRGPGMATQVDDLTLFESFIHAVCSDLDVEIPNTGIRQIAVDLLTIWDKYVHLDSHCFPVLDELNQRGMTLGLVSNFDHPPHIWDLVRSSGLDRLLTTVVVSGDVGTRKPDPAIFHLALEKPGLQPYDTIYVGDAEEDMVGANDAGMISVLIDRDGHGKDYGQRETITSLRDIFGVLTTTDDKRKA